MKDEIMLTLALTVICLLSFAFGLVIGIDHMRKEAAHNGMAHWNVNESGQTSFCWNTHLLTPKVLDQ
jgi:hypothetical protein